MASRKFPTKEKLDENAERPNAHKGKERSWHSFLSQALLPLLTFDSITGTYNKTDMKVVGNRAKFAHGIIYWRSLILCSSLFFANRYLLHVLCSLYETNLTWAPHETNLTWAQLLGAGVLFP